MITVQGCRISPNCTLKKSDVFLVYDGADSDRANIILETLNNNGIQCCTTDYCAGKHIIAMFKERVATVKKVVLIYSTSFSQNELLNFCISYYIIQHSLCIIHSDQIYKHMWALK
jgi:hypothetical protein